MKTFFVKKAKGARPVIGASILEKKPSVGEYINFNVPTNVKIAMTRQGSLSGRFIPEMNTLLNADQITINIGTDYNENVGASYFDFSTAVAPFNGDNTIGVLLNALNTKLGGLGHVVLEDGVFYLTKLGLDGEINYATIGTYNWC